MTMPCGENSVSMRRTSAADERGIVQPLRPGHCLQLAVAVRRGRGLGPQVQGLEQLPGLRMALGLGGAAALGRQQNQRPQVARVPDAARRDALSVVRVA